MEQEHLSPPTPDVVPCPCDEETFRRVWRRVMPEDRADSPILLHDHAEAAGPPALAPAAAAPVPTAEPTILPLRLTETPDVADNDVPCLGASSAIYNTLLQQYIDHELADWRTYLALSRRAGGASRTLATIAADERRHAKRLSTAHFLISGVRYFPVDRAAAPPPMPLAAALRESFAEEQRGEASYRAAAAETSDPCLRELYLELAQDENAHMWLIRNLLEQL